MPKIPINKIPAAMPGTYLPSARASASMFVTDTGATAQALGGLGAGLTRLGGTLGRIAHEEQRKKDQAELVNTIAQMDFNPARIDARQQALAEDPSGSTYGPRLKERLFSELGRQTDQIKNDFVRNGVKKYYTSRFLNYIHGAYQESMVLQKKYEIAQLETSFRSLVNQVLSDPSAYQEATEKAALLFSQNPGLSNPKVQDSFFQQLARAQIDGMFSSVSTIADADNIALKLQEEEIKSLLDPRDYTRFLKQAETIKKSLYKASSARARSMMADLRSQSTAGYLLNPQTLAFVENAVSVSENPELQEQFEQLAVEQSHLRGIRKMSPSEIKLASKRIIIGGTGTPKEKTQFIQTAASAAPSITASFFAALSSDMDLPEETVTAISEKYAEEMKDVPEKDRLATANALLARENQYALATVLGRVPNDAELYLAHFLGPDKALVLADTFEGDRDREVYDVFPAEALDALPEGTIGQDMTVGQLVGNLFERFSRTPTRHQLHLSEFYSKVADSKQAQLESDPIGQGIRDGLIDDVSVFREPDARAHSLQVLADYYKMPVNMIKPLRPHEEMEAKKHLEDADPEKVLEGFGLLARGGVEFGIQSLQQLGYKGSVYEAAFALLATGGDSSIAANIVYGHKFLEENKKLYSEELRHFKEDVTADLMEATGLVGSPQQLFDASFAYYLQTRLRTGEAYTPLGAAQALSEVITGNVNSKEAFFVRNGELVVVPRNGTPGRFNEFVDTATEQEWLEVSSNGRPAIYANGDKVSPGELRDAIPKAVGNDTYVFKNSDGEFYLTNTGEIYKAQLSLSNINRLLERASDKNRFGKREIMIGEVGP